MRSKLVIYTFIQGLVVAIDRLGYSYQTVLLRVDADWLFGNQC